MAGRFYSAGWVKKRRDCSKHARGGDTWTITATYRETDAEGHSKRHTRSQNVTAKNKTDAKGQLLDWVDNLNAKHKRDSRRGSSAVRAGQTPVADYVAAYIDMRERSKDIEASTIRGYRGSLNHIRDGFEGVTLEQLRPDMVQEWEANLTAAGLSSSTVGKAHRLLKQVCTYAAGTKAIDDVPFFNVHPPKREKKNKGINALGKAERAELMRKLSELEATPTTTAAQLSLWTGLRRGEICGLQWRDFDAKSGTLRIRQSIGEGKGGTYLKPPKTDRERTIFLAPSAIDLLNGWKATQRARFSDMGATLTRDSFIVGDPAGYYSPTYLTREWHALAKSFGIRGTEGRIPTFHDLRHTWATMFIGSGGDAVTAANNLGHAKPSMTLDVYAAPDPNAQREAAQRIQAVM